MADKDKPWTSAVCFRWFWTHLGLAIHSPGGLFTDAVLASVVKLLINLKECTTAVIYLSLANKNTFGFKLRVKKKTRLTSRGMPSGSRHPVGK